VVTAWVAEWAHQIRAVSRASYRFAPYAIKVHFFT
jgi:hypothetical protein